MAKIILNNKEFQIDDATLAPAIADLKSHLSTVMNGEGAVIALDGVEYGIDATKLAAAKDDFVAHLGTIAGSGAEVVVNGTKYSVDSTKLSGATSALSTAFDNLASGGGSTPDTPDTPEEERLEGDGAEYYTLAPTALSFRSTAPLNELQEVQINGVTVDPSNYTLEEGSTIVTFPIDYLKTLDVGNYEVAVASDSKTVKGDFTVAAPELNEHGFYYNQPYSANLPMFGGDTAFFVREDGTYDIITVGKIPDTGEYTMNGNNIVATHSLLGTITCTISSDGTEVFCNELQVAFELNGSITIAADDDYIYEYKEDLGGYEVKAIDKTKAEYGAIKTGINGIDTVKLEDYMFCDPSTLDGTSNMTLSPAIPSTIKIIGKSAFRMCSSLESVTIPVSVENIDEWAFNGCVKLKNVTFEDDCKLEVIGERAFGFCSSLTSITISDSVTNISKWAFVDCTSITNLTFTGTVGQWNSITKGDEWALLVPATHVQCSDGQVAL